MIFKHIYYSNLFHYQHGWVETIHPSILLDEVIMCKIYDSCNLGNKIMLWGTVGIFIRKNLGEFQMYILEWLKHKED